MVVIDFFFWMVGGLLIFAIAYLYFLAAVSLFTPRKGILSEEPTTRFTVLIPARNEAMIIKKTLGLRTSREEEMRGLDIGEHGMEAYSGFQIFTNQ